MKRLVDIDKMYDDLANELLKSDNTDYQAGLMTAMQYLYEKKPVLKRAPKKPKNENKAILNKLYKDYKKGTVQTTTKHHTLKEGDIVYSSSHDLLGIITKIYPYSLPPTVSTPGFYGYAFWVDDWKWTEYQMSTHDWDEFWSKKFIL